MIGAAFTDAACSLIKEIPKMVNTYYNPAAGVLEGLGQQKGAQEFPGAQASGGGSNQDDMSAGNSEVGVQMKILNGHINNIGTFFNLDDKTLNEKQIESTVGKQIELLQDIKSNIDGAASNGANKHLIEKMRTMTNVLIGKYDNLIR